MKELLFELGTEEIPARLLMRARDELIAKVDKALDALGLEHSPIVGYATPRRLALVTQIQAAQADRTEERVGPPTRIAFDAEGNPTRAALSFADRNGLKVEALDRVDTPKGEKLAATVHIAGQQTKALLPEVLVEAVTSLHWPKAMRWGARADAFIRPVHWAVALFGGELVPLEVYGVASGTRTRGHRFLAPDEIEVADAAGWLEALRAAKVEPDYERRMQDIRQGTEALAASVGGKALITEGLLHEVTSIVEWPVPLLGTFEEAYLELPAHVLTTPMKEHQKYFPIEAADGSLSNHFVVVSGTIVADPSVVASGNGRVLRARLADAKFFWTTDLATPLDRFAERLGERIFLKGLGTVFDKAKRIEALAPKLVETIDLDGAELAPLAARAGWLAKADLSTAMVNEFDSLQGWMGRDYARKAGEDERVASAIFEHYLPRFAGDALPPSPVGAAVALADKLDSIVGCFALGLEPTGSADPYALRRQALGVIRIIEARDPSPTLGQALDLARGALAEVVSEAEWPALKARILAFFEGRMRSALAKEFSADLVAAVLEVGFEDPADARGRLAALDALKQSPGWDDLAVAVKRVVKISEGHEAGRLDPSSLTESAAQALHAAYLEVQGAASAALDAGRYDEALERLVSLKPSIDRFFDEVLVISDVPAERERRLALLHAIAGLFHRIAAFDKVST